MKQKITPLLLLLPFLGVTALVLQLKEEFQMTVILMTHDREEALSMSDRIALRLKASGDYALTVEQIIFRGSDALVVLRSEDGTVWKKAVQGNIPFETSDTIHTSLDLADPILFS